MRFSLAQVPAAPVFALAAAVTLSACGDKSGGVELKPSDVIPAAADIVVGIELGDLIAAPAFKPFGAMAQADSDLKEIITAWNGCKLNTTKIHVTFATTLASEADDIVVFVDSPGIGTSESVKCLEDELAKAAGEEPGWVHFTKRGKVMAAATMISCQPQKLTFDRRATPATP